MNIGEFSKKTGIPIDTLRYYNKINLLIPARTNKIRIYTEDDLEKAVAILKLKKLNFTLDEIKSLFNLENFIETYATPNNESLEKVKVCLDIIESKFQDILKQEQDLNFTKLALKNMIDKTNKIIENPNTLSVLLDSENK